MNITQSLRTVYYSVALCLFVWGIGWLIYEFTFIQNYFSTSTFQNILLVILGTALSFVTWTGLSPKKEQVIHVKDKPSVAVLSRDELEAKLFETDPNSKERKQILKQLNEMKK